MIKFSNEKQSALAGFSLIFLLFIRLETRFKLQDYYRGVLSKMEPSK